MIVKGSHRSIYSYKITSRKWSDVIYSYRPWKMEEDEREEEREEIWSWGAGTEGQLATEELQDEHIPRLVGGGAAPFSLLSCGGAHVIALTSEGKVLTWGRGNSGQLGHGEMTNSVKPKYVEALESFTLSHVSAGWNHSGFVTDDGCVFTCGDGSFGQLGHGDYESQNLPVNISSLSSKHVEQIACGMRHTLVLLKGHSGGVYGFGSAKRGQLGISTQNIRSIFIPKMTVGLEDIEIESIHANGDHSAALSADGCMFTWGRGFSGNSDAYTPQCLNHPLSFTQIALGWNHALLLTDSGVYMLGGKNHGVLGESDRKNQVEHVSENSEEVVPRKVDSLDGIKVLQISAGAEHSALVTENGSIMTWGWGEHGQLGLGTTDDQISPQIVVLDNKLTNTHYKTEVFCGSGFTFALRKFSK